MVVLLKKDKTPTSDHQLMRQVEYYLNKEHIGFADSQNDYLLELPANLRL